MQQNTIYLNLFTAQHVSGGISTHHHELITLYVYLQYLALMRPLLLPVVNVAGGGELGGTAVPPSSPPATFTTGSSNGLINARYCGYSVMSS